MNISSRAQNKARLREFLKLAGELVDPARV